MLHYKIIAFVSCWLFAAMVVSAESSLLEKANQLYAEKQFKEAAAKYEEVKQHEGSAAELYYNLGNAYFKSNELGLAILNYERALRLKPSYADAEHNLQFANLSVIDNVTLDDPFFLRKWMISLIKLQTSNQWFVMAVFMFFVFLLSALMFIFGKSKFIRKASFYAGLAALMISLLSIQFSLARKNQMIQHNEGIVISGVVVIKSAPDRSGTDLYQLHEGTKVSVLSVLGDWYEIQPGNGTKGWVELKHIERI